MKLDGRKVYLNDWLEDLIFNIDLNIKINTEIYDKINDNECKKYIERDNKLKEKLEQYKKTDENNKVYFYFFPSELETIMWIFLENYCKGTNELIKKTNIQN